MLRLTIWMNYPSLHQGDLFRAVASSEGVDLQVIFARGMPDQRLQFGWQNDLRGYSYRFLNERHRIPDAMRLAWSQRDRLHVVNGFWTEPSFAAALTVMRLVRSAFAIYSEAPEPDVPRSAGKRLLQAAFGKLLAPKASGALSISHLATEFYRKLGVREAVIYPFGYFSSHPRLMGRSKDENATEIIFVGQLIPRKGIDLLLDAMQPLFGQHPNLRLSVIGSGELLAHLQEQAAALGLSDRVAFEGVIPPASIRERIAVADLLVLPSRWDGWGAVVNEALSVGVPVIVSDRCGAADLVRKGINGYVFRSEDAEDLRACLSDFLNRRVDWPRFRAKAAAIGDRISSEEVTPYLIKCLKHMTGAVSERPNPPWAQSNVFEDVI